MDLQALYGRYSHLWMPPWYSHPQANALSMGFVTAYLRSDTNTPPTVDVSAESKRSMGSVAALAATRDALVYAESQLSAATSANWNTALLSSADQILELISGAIGDDQIAIRPTMEPMTGEGGTASPCTSGTGGWTWEVDAVIPIDKPPLQNFLFVVNDPAAAPLVRYPAAALLGRTALSVVAGSGAAAPQTTSPTSTFQTSTLQRNFTGEM